MHNILYNIYNGIGKTDDIILSIRIAYLRMGDKRGMIYIYIYCIQTLEHIKGENPSYGPRF